MDSSDNGSSSVPVGKADDTFIATIILGIVVVIVIFAAVYVWMNKEMLGIKGIGLGETKFVPPSERQEYIVAKGRLAGSLTVYDDSLKKLLMKRAYASIPILLQLQNEGSSIDRLYKKGILTDDMHYRVKELRVFFDKEFKDIQEEAEELVEGWGQHIWPQAMQYYQVIIFLLLNNRA